MSMSSRFLLAALVAFALSSVVAQAWTTPASWTETVLWSFGPTDGEPTDVVAGAGGALYGAAQVGNSACRQVTCGYVFRLAPPRPGEPTWTKTIIHEFSYSDPAGFLPQAGLRMDANGAVYGTTYYGGVATCDLNLGCGAVFKLTPPAPGQLVWTETILHQFTYADGAHPRARLVADAQGNIYGTTVRGGASNGGVAFEIAAGTGAFSVLHSFGGYVDAAPPQGLVVGPGGVLYGTTQGGSRSYSYGTVFSLTPPTRRGRLWPHDTLRRLNGGPSSTPWTETILYSFTNLADGETPAADLMLDPSGALYGTSYRGGGQGKAGTVFKLSPPVGSTAPWTHSTLFTFTYPGVGGGFPVAGLTTYPIGGALFGTASYGGGVGGGIAFILLPPRPGRPGWTEGTIHNFGGPVDGNTPSTGMIVGTDGVLYGTTTDGGRNHFGTIFSLRHH